MDRSCIEIQRSILLRVLLSYKQIRYLFSSRRFTAQLSSIERVKGQLSPESIFRGIDRRTEVPTTTDSSCFFLFHRFQFLVLYSSNFFLLVAHSVA
jgi:hypothetical protein